MNRMWIQYPALVFFYSQEVRECAGNISALNMLSSLTDLEMLLAIPALLPLLKCLNTLVKGLQREEVDLYTLAGLLRSTRYNIRSMFGLLPEEEATTTAHGRFKTIAHDDFNKLAYGKLDQLELRWVGKDQSVLALIVSYPGPDGQTLEKEFPLTCVPPASGHRGRPNTRPEPVTSALFNLILEYVELTMQAIARFTLEELDERFAADADLDVFGPLNPEWWQSDDAEAQAQQVGESVVSLADRYGKPMETLVGGARAAPLLDGDLLKNQSAAFMVMMRDIAPSFLASLSPQQKLRPTATFWERVDSMPRMRDTVTEFIKAVKISLSIAVTSVEDERTFSTLNHVKSAVRNRLADDHLVGAVRVFSQDFYTTANFPYDEAIENWKQNATIRGRYKQASLT